MEKKEYVMDNCLIHGHQPCQTREAQYVCVDSIYEKLHRPNYYDLGGTYMQEMADYWFVSRTDQIGEVFLIHIFLTNKHEGIVSLSISSSETIIFDKEKSIAYLSSDLTKYDFGKLKESTLKYVTTYSFDIYEVDMLKDKQLFIPISFLDKAESRSAEVVLDFSPLLEDPIGADFTIESEDGEKFQAHKVLLMAHSEVFRAMLKEDTAESKNNYVKLIDVSKEDLHHLLYFIYSGKLGMDIENINFFNMLILADRFNLIGLRELSEHALIQQITNENALEMLAVADSYNSHSLKCASMIFIKKNKSALQNSIFDEINNAELLRELCKFIVS